MATAQISGLSGFDGASLVDQLMQLEANTQRSLQTKVKAEQTVLSTLQSLNTALSKLAEQAKNLGKAETWNALTPTSSSTAVTVIADKTAAAAQLDFTVSSVARSHQQAWNDPRALTDTVLTGTTLTLTRGGTSTEIAVADGSLKGVMDAINGADAGLRATAVRSGTGYNLLVESTATGAAERFTLEAGPGGSLALGQPSTREATDARLVLGALEVTSATNTFEDLVPGLDVTVSAAAVGTTPVSVTVARDPKALSDSVKALVDAANAILTGIGSQTAYDSKTGSGGQLLGDSTVRALRNDLLESIYPADGTSLAGVGIQVDRYGKLVFDADAFASAYAADPAGVAAKFDTAGNGFAARVEKVGKDYSDPYTGTLTAAITGRTAGIDRLEDSIEAWSVRLELRRNTLSRQFTALEVALNTMNSQSSWLSSQLGQLSANNG
ncbi:flagellar filament capping protein FliD [Nocardioides pantholopis]|uniref:flagellar filament capping protein FliD n=1 Tax=Nocardioides pantholopis TaxID=2483798 RepID=UPI000F078DF9|nr:flagellar filament capping protein FliD [Nocardioides pantholopis]